jgi:hypothetical protein
LRIEGRPGNPPKSPRLPLNSLPPSSLVRSLTHVEQHLSFLILLHGSLKAIAKPVIDIILNEVKRLFGITPNRTMGTTLHFGVSPQDPNGLPGSNLFII